MLPFKITYVTIKQPHYSVWTTRMPNVCKLQTTDINVNHLAQQIRKSVAKTLITF